MRYLKFNSLLLGWIIITTSAMAQVIPPSLNPGAVNNTLTQPNAPSPLNEPVPLELELPPTAPTTFTSSDNTRVWIRTLKLQGNTLLSASDLTLLNQPAQMMNFAAMRQLAEQLTQRYVDKGYVNSRVIVPPQDFTTGELVLQAHEVAIGQINWHKSRWFAPMATRMTIRPGEPFHLPTLSREIRLTNQNPDQHWTATLSPGEAVDTVNVDLNAKTRFPVHLSPFMDNLGRERIGRARYGIGLTHNNVTGLGDTLSSSVSFTRSSLGLVNQYRLPVGPFGTQIGTDYSYSHLRLGGSLKPLDITASAHVWSPTVEHPLWLNDQADVKASLTLDLKNLKTDLLDRPFYRDRIVVLRPGLQAAFWHHRGKTWLSQELGIGLPGLGATDSHNALSSKPGSSSHFVRLTGQLGRWQTLPWGMTLQCRGGYQYAPYRLQAPEQTQIGGAFTVRGYSEGVALGDSGWFTGVEWAVPSYFLPKQVVIHGKPLFSPRQVIQWVAFADAGQTWTTRPQPNEKKQTTLVGVGLGIRILFNRFITGRLDVGFPLTGDAEHHPRVHVGLQAGLF